METETYKGETYERIKFDEISIGDRLFRASATGDKFQSYGTVTEIEEIIIQSTGAKQNRIVFGNGRKMRKGDFKRIWRSV